MGTHPVLEIKEMMSSILPDLRFALRHLVAGVLRHWMGLVQVGQVVGLGGGFVLALSVRGVVRGVRPAQAGAYALAALPKAE